MLTERFAVAPGERDRAVDLLRSADEVFDVEDGGIDLDREGREWPVIVVKSAEDVENASATTREAFDTAIGDVLTAGEVTWRPIAQPRYVNRGLVRRLRESRIFGGRSGRAGQER